MKLGHWPKGGGGKLSLFSLYRLRVLRYWPIFKHAIFGHESCPWAKVPEVAHFLPFYPRGGEIELIFALRPTVKGDKAILDLNYAN